MSAKLNFVGIYFREIFSFLANTSRKRDYSTKYALLADCHYANPSQNQNGYLSPKAKVEAIKVPS